MQTAVFKERNKMADEIDELVCSVLLDRKYDFVVVVSKSRTIGELRVEIDDVAREVYPEFRGGQVSRVENQRGSILPDRYKVGVVLKNESRIICYSSGGKEKENMKKRSQQVQTSENVRNKPSATNNKAKCSLLETRRTVSHTVCSLSEDMLTASKYKSLFSMPEHRRPKRKEAIETSASKVVEWLSCHDVSSNVDAQDSQSDDGTMEVESESEDQPKSVEGKRVPVVEKRVETVTSINRKGCSDDDEDDNDADDIDYDVEDDGGSYRENEDSDTGNRDNSMVHESRNNSKQATAKKTTCYTPKSVSAKRDARVSVSTSKSKRRAVGCTSKTNEALSTTSRGTQSNLTPLASDRETRSTINSGFPSSGGNLRKCRVKIQKLPICIKHGRNLKVLRCATQHENNKRRQHGDVKPNRGSEDNCEHRKEKESDSIVPQKEVYPFTAKNQRIQKTKNTRRNDHYTDIDRDMESGGELSNDRRRKLVNSLSGTDRIRNRLPKRAKIQRRRYVETSVQETTRDEHDDHGGLLTENTDNSNGVNRGLRQSSQPPLEDATTKNDNDSDGDNDEDDDESDELTRHNHKTRLTVAEVYDDEEDDVISSLASDTAMSEFDIQRGAGCKEKGEIFWKGKEIQTKDTNSTEESRTRNIDKHVDKQVSNEKDMASPPRQCRSPRKNLLSKKSLSPSKSKASVEASKQRTDNTFGHDTVDNSGERQLCRATKETCRLDMKDKSPAKRPVHIESSKGKYCGDSVDKAPGIVIEESRESVMDSIVESAGNTNVHASKDDTCQEMEANDVSQTDEETEGENKESTPLYLTPIKKGEQVAWLKESSREAVSEQTGDVYEDFMRGLEMSVCNITSHESKRSNSPPLSSETGKDNESNKEKGQDDVESRKNSESKSTKKKKRSELVENVNQEGGADRRIICEIALEGNVELKSTSQSPIKKRTSEQKQQNLQDEDTLVEDIGQESVSDRRVISEKTMEGNLAPELTPQRPIKKRSEQKQRKLQKNEETPLENVGQESVSDTAVTSKKRLGKNVELECAAEDPVNNNNNLNVALKRKAAERDYQCDLLKGSDSQASVGMETPKKKAREDAYCEDKRNNNDKKTLNRKTVEGADNISDGLQEGNQKDMLKKNKKKKKTREKRKKKRELSGTERTPESTLASPILKKIELSQSKDQQNERVEREFATSAKNKHQISNGKANKESKCGLLQIEQESQAFLGEEKPKKKDRYCEEKRSADYEKSNDRQTSNQLGEVNSMSDKLQKEIYVRQSKKKEKRKTGEVNSMESATEIPSPTTLGTVTSDSLDDSGYSENRHNKSKQHEQCRPEQVESVQQPRISMKRKAATNGGKETHSGQGLHTSKPDADYSEKKTNSKKKSKTSLSLLDLALDDDTAEQGSLNKASNRKTVRSEGRPVHQMARHFRQTPKGFLHSAKMRRTSSQSTIVIRRKPRINPKASLEMMAKGKALVTSGVSFEQLLDDESLWTT